MIDPRDPLERLRAVNPVPAGDVAGILADPVLFDRITTRQAPARVPVGAASPVRRRARRLVPAVLIATLLGGAVAYAVRRDQVSKPETVACFRAADLTAPTEVLVVEAGNDPVTTCTGLWRSGAFGDRADVPPLVACVLESGVAGVFPTPSGVDVCRALDLPPVGRAPTEPTPSGATGSSGDVNERILVFRDAALAQFLAADCVTPEAGAEIARRELARAGLDGWTIVDGGITPARPCASLAIRPEVRQVVLAPTTPRR